MNQAEPNIYENNNNQNQVPFFKATYWRHSRKRGGKIAANISDDYIYTYVCAYVCITKMYYIDAVLTFFPVKLHVFIFIINCDDSD
jgi:hypothetical protein